MERHMAYHYTSRQKLQLILRDGELRPMGPLANPFYGKSPVIPELAYKDLLFAFLDSPIPSGWSSNRNVLNKLMVYLLPESHHMAPAGTKIRDYTEADLRQRRVDEKIVRLDFELDSCVEAYVVDRWLFERDWENYLASFPKYVRSAIRLEDYGGGYELPELLLTKPVPISKIKIVENPPIF